MIKREMYMKRIRPFIRTELIKVMTGIRRRWASWHQDRQWCTGISVGLEKRL